MEEIVKQEPVINKKVLLNSLKIFAITLGIAVFVFFFTVSAIFVIAPKNDAKLFSFLGLKKAEEACYIRQYKKTGSNVDLYNVILFESELENYEKELMYINELMSDDEYKEFYTKLDKSAVEAVDDKSLIAYTCNTNGYLINQKIKCMYELDFNEINILNYIKTQLSQDEFLFDSAFSTYVEIVNSDEDLSKEQKQEKVEMAFGAVDVLVTERLSNLIDYINSDISVEQEIIAQNSIVNILKAVYMIDVINEVPEVAISKSEYQTALRDYNELINA